jgi:crotonobetainyl-CoA:carnitine CoA-transferase CaiB-like acyl-CoA transferase
VIVGARPADALRRGIDFETLSRANPRLIYCAITGYGETGPWAGYPAHGLNPDAFAGLVEADLSGPSPQPPQFYQSVGAPLAGVFAALGILEGVRRRDLGEPAQYVHVSMWGAAMWFNWRHTTAEANLGEPWHAYGELGPRYAMYRTADERVILVCPIERKFWHRFVDLLGLPAEWRDRGSWAANGMDFGEGNEDEAEAIAAEMVKRPLREWMDVLQAADIPFAPLLTIAEALGSDQARASQVMKTSSVEGRDVFVPDLPVRLSGERTGAKPSAPLLGDDGREVLDELGLGELDPEDLR